jgi:hypothetical protein
MLEVIVMVRFRVSGSVIVGVMLSDRVSVSVKVRVRVSVSFDSYFTYKFK